MEARPPGGDSEAWRARARTFSETALLPRVEEMERADRIPPDLLSELGDLGFMGLAVPAAFGGAEASTRTTVAVLSEIARASAAVATLLSVHLSVASAPIAVWGSEEQKERFLPRMARGEWLGAFALTEPGVGSDAAHLTTRYRREGERFRLDGAKMFITNGGLADVVVTFARRDASEGSRGVSAFLLEKGMAGLSVAQRLEKLGLRASETTELVFEGLSLPRTALLGAEGEGLHLALRALTDGRVGIAACALGVAEAAFEELCSAGHERPGEGAHSVVARAFTELVAARAVVEHAAARKDAGRPFVPEASAAKLFSARAAVGISNLAVELRGPAGALEGARAARLMRDARVFPIVEGTTEIQELILGREILGR